MIDDLEDVCACGMILCEGGCGNERCPLCLTSGCVCEECEACLEYIAWMERETDCLG